MQHPPASAERRRRLQRPPDFTGERLTRFRDVWFRHGLPGLLLALVLLVCLAGGHALLEVSLAPAVANPFFYAAVFVAALALLLAHSRWNAGEWHVPTLLWLGYLGLLSLWEEWAFRVALPIGLGALGLDKAAAVVLANALFAAMHYFTLRWRWQLCVGAALGGLLLSRNFAMQGDLLLIAGLHWMGTYLNTPRLPSAR